MSVISCLLLLPFEIQEAETILQVNLMKLNEDIEKGLLKSSCSVREFLPTATAFFSGWDILEYMLLARITCINALDAFVLADELTAEIARGLEDKPDSYTGLNRKEAKELVAYVMGNPYGHVKEVNSLALSMQLLVEDELIHCWKIVCLGIQRLFQISVDERSPQILKLEFNNRTPSQSSQHSRAALLCMDHA
jgi:hypothetical protein